MSNSTLHECKFDTFQKEIDKCKSKKFDYHVTIKKKKKNKRSTATPFTFLIVDGHYQWKLTFNPEIKCLCGSDKIFCAHVIKILHEYFKLSDVVISLMHLPEVYTVFIELIHKRVDIDDYDVKLLETINSKFEDEECLICLEDMVCCKYRYRFYSCEFCDQTVHYKCMQRWNTQKLTKKTGESYETNGCVHCRNKIDKDKFKSLFD